MSGIKIPKHPQTPQMAVGSAFDSFIKAEIARLLGKPNRLSELIKTVDNWEYVKIGNEICQEYIRQGCLKTLMDEGLTEIEIKGEDGLCHGILPGTDIPVAGIPDAAFSDGTPVDWKVSGYKSRKRSPTQGYTRLIHNNFNRGRHDKYYQPMHKINERWALQLIFYNWMLKQPVRKYTGAIEEIIIKDDKLYFGSFRNHIDPTYAMDIRNKVMNKWNRLAKGEIDTPKPSVYLCEPYGTPRTCTLACTYYLELFDDPIMRAVLKG